MGTPKKNEEYGYYESAFYMAGRIDCTDGNYYKRTIITIDGEGNMFLERVKGNGQAGTSSRTLDIESFQISDDGRTIVEAGSDDINYAWVVGPHPGIYKILNGVYDLQ